MPNSPVWRWQFCWCYGNNSLTSDPRCQFCDNHGRCQACKVWDDSRQESSTSNTSSSHHETPTMSSKSPQADHQKQRREGYRSTRTLSLPVHVICAFADEKVNKNSRISSEISALCLSCKHYRRRSKFGDVAYLGRYLVRGCSSSEKSYGMIPAQSRVGALRFLISSPL